MLYSGGQSLYFVGKDICIHLFVEDGQRNYVILSA